MGETVEFDTYVPFKVTLGPQPPFGATYCYLRTGGSERSLLMVTAIGETKLLYQVTLVLADRVTVNPGGERTPVFGPRMGVPKVNVDEWGGERAESPTPFAVIVGRATLRISWSSTPPVSVVSTSGRVRFGLNDEQELTMVEVVDVTAEEMSRARVALGVDPWVIAEQGG